MNGTEQFIADLAIKCEHLGVKLHLPNTTYVTYGKFRISGYFDEKTLACAMGKKDSIPTLVHESCHLDQWEEKIKLWNLKSINVDDWLSGKDFETKEVEKALKQLKFLELDCEKRSVKKMERYGISFNKKEYIQKSNAYVQFYNYIKYSRKWCKKTNTPYNNKNVWKAMPDKWMPKKWYDAISDEHLAIFMQNNI